jgi:Tfp pilus assembly protein PilX
LIVLAAMSLAAVGLMRGVLGSNRVAGNLAFQQTTLQAGDVGVETAIAWLEQKTLETAPVPAGAPAGTQPLPANKLFADISKSSTETYNYVATRADPKAGKNWDDFWKALAAAGQVNTLPTDAAGNTVSFVIHRLCTNTGDPTTAGCEATPTLPPSIKTSSKSNSLKLSESSQVYYRITVRVQGPRNAVSFIQAIAAI